MLKIACDREATAPMNLPIDNLGLKLLVNQPPLPECEVCVIVPARNEAEKIEATLQALLNQTDLDGNLLDKKRYEIIVLANNCNDNSAAIAHRFSQHYPSLILHVVEITLDSKHAYIGWVRKLLMDEAYRRLTLLRHEGVIASTDGDTQVAATWIAAILYEIKQGADAVGGRIIANPTERALLSKAAQLYFLRYVSYRHLTAQLEGYLDSNPFDPLPRHHQHFGGSLAVTTQMYSKVGGLPPVRTPEDVAFFEALMRVDARFRHSPIVQVVTSARAVGRAPAGLSQRLSQLSQMGQEQQPMLVESADLIEVRFQIRRQLRLLWQQVQVGERLPAEIAIVTDALDVPANWLNRACSSSPTFGQLVERIGQYQQLRSNFYRQYWHKVKIQEAITQLRIKVNVASRHCSRQHLVTALESFKQVKPILLLPQPI